MREEDTAIYPAIYLIIPEVLQDVQPVPCFLTKSYIPPFVSIMANLCCHLDIASLFCEDCGDTVSDSTAVTISVSKS